ncbi:MAG: hypothetical protein IAE86_03400 [Burkholderiaceae bacterium]|nr:hypothetical protein [Burkholderiaceae bacterium]
MSQTYNRAVLRHEFNCTAIFSDKSFRASGTRREATVIDPAESAPAQAAMTRSAPTLAGILVAHSRGGDPAASAARGVAGRLARVDVVRLALRARLELKDHDR